jgi:hypothetical protein
MPADIIRLTVPLPPSANPNSRTGEGDHYTPAVFRQFRRGAAAAIEHQLPPHVTLTGRWPSG